jgi:hypothetical protein
VPAELTHVVVDGCAVPVQGLILDLVADAESLRFEPAGATSHDLALARLIFGPGEVVVQVPGAAPVEKVLRPGGRLKVRREGRLNELWGIYCPGRPADGDEAGGEAG